MRKRFTEKTWPRLYCFLIAILTVFMSVPSIAADRNKPLAPPAPSRIETVGSIPLGFKTYTLFLFCGHEWNEPQKRPHIRTIYNNFLKLSDSIGEQNAAMWFWEDRSLGHVDVKRSQDFCTAFDLPPNSSPYLLVTSFPPILDGDLATLEASVSKTLLQEATNYANWWAASTRKEPYLSKLKEGLKDLDRSRPNWKTQLSKSAIGIIAAAELIVKKTEELANRYDTDLPGKFAYQQSDIEEIGSMLAWLDEASQLTENEFSVIKDIYNQLKTFPELRCFPLSEHRQRLMNIDANEKWLYYTAFRDAILNIGIYRTSSTSNFNFTKGFEVTRDKQTTVDAEMQELGPYHHVTEYLTILQAYYVRPTKYERFAVPLGGIPPQDVVKVINVLDQNIRIGKDFERGVTYERLRLVVKNAFEKGFKQLGPLIDQFGPLFSKMGSH